MERRDLLKGLLGAPVAVLVGGKILPDAAELEAYGDTALVVPKTGIHLPESKTELLGFTVPSGGGMSHQFTQPIVLRAGEDIWLHVGRLEDDSMLTSLWLMNSGMESQAYLTAKSLRA